MLSYEERAAEWRRRFDDQRSSGLTVSAWCHQNGITKNAFYDWRKRLSKTPAPSAPRFISLAVAPPTRGYQLERGADAPTQVPSSLTLRIGRATVEVASGFDPALLADVLSILESRA
jgi:transposase-like protein